VRRVIDIHARSHKANGMGWGILQLLPLVNMLKTLQGLDTASSNS
jgi:hypothetical protein